MVEIAYGMSGRRVVASVAGEEIGRILVPDIPLHWSQRVLVSVAGISGVGTDERFRRQDIAAHMMKEAVRFAREEGYGGSAVSTEARNVARRLYSRSGYVHLFFMHRFSREIAPGKEVVSPEKWSIRPYEEADRPEVLSLIRQTEHPFFGAREKIEKKWQQARSSVGDQPAPLAFVALQDGDVVGFADRFLHWNSPTGEVFACPGDDQFRIGEALVNALEQAAARLGEKSLCFWATDPEDFPVRLLCNRGYRLVASRVFKFNILSLQKLLDQLGELFRRRASVLEPSDLPVRISLSYQEQRGVLQLGGQGGEIELAAPRHVVTRVLCGTFSAWDAYLRGLMHIRPTVDERVHQALEALLPSIPYQHPVNDWW